MVRIMCLLRTKNDIAGQSERITRGIVNSGHTRRRAVIVPRIIPAGNQPDAASKRLVERIAEESPQMRERNSKVKGIRTRDIIVVSPRRENNFGTLSSNELSSFDRNPFTEGNSCSQIGFSQLRRRFPV